MKTKLGTHMRTFKKTSIVLASWGIALAGLQNQSAQALGLLTPGGPADTGTSVLADALGANTGPEAITISWSVSESLADVYTYTYVVNNPVGDVVLNNDGSPSTTPEIVDAFSVGFNTTLPGAFVMGSQTGGVYDANNGTGGLFWAFTPVNAGTSSGPLSFQSDNAPTLGNANAQDRNPPSPWASNPDGQQVPIPNAVPEPSTMVLFALASFLMPMRSRLFRFIRKG
jgi:hypothetical protein